MLQAMLKRLTYPPITIKSIVIDTLHLFVMTDFVWWDAFGNVTHFKSVGNQLPAYYFRIELLRHSALVVMIQSESTRGSFGQTKNQVVPSAQVTTPPYIDQVTGLSVDSHCRDMIDSCLHWGKTSLVFATLVFAPSTNTKRQNAGGD